MAKIRAQTVVGNSVTDENYVDGILQMKGFGENEQEKEQMTQPLYVWQ